MTMLDVLDGGREGGRKGGRQALHTTYIVAGDDMFPELDLSEGPDPQGFEQLIVPYLQRIVRHYAPL